MDKVGLYRQVSRSYKELCANGLQSSSFHSCLDHGVDQCQMPVVLKGEFQKITTTRATGPPNTPIEKYREILKPHKNSRPVSGRPFF